MDLLKRSLLILSICIILGGLFFIISSKISVHTNLSDENIDNLYLLSDMTPYIESELR